jgi:hypothetical protein
VDAYDKVAGLDPFLGQEFLGRNPFARAEKKARLGVKDRFSQMFE